MLSLAGALQRESVNIKHDPMCASIVMTRSDRSAEKSKRNTDNKW